MGEGPDVAQRWFVEWTPEVLALRDSLLEVNLLEVGAGIAAAAGEAERAARVAGCTDARRAALTCDAHSWTSSSSRCSLNLLARRSATRGWRPLVVTGPRSLWPRPSNATSLPLLAGEARPTDHCVDPWDGCDKWVEVNIPCG